MMKSKQHKPKACTKNNWPTECPMVRDDASVCESNCFFICPICNKGFDGQEGFLWSSLCEEHRKQVINEFRSQNVSSKNNSQDFPNNSQKVEGSK